MTGRLRTIAITVGIATGAALAWSNLGGGGSPVGTSQAALPGNPLDAVMQARGLTPDEAEAALKTFVPPGKYDDFLMVTSGGHRGTIMLYGIPSMRLLKEVPVYAPRFVAGLGSGGHRVRRGGQGGDLRRRPADADVG